MEGEPPGGPPEGDFSRRLSLFQRVELGEAPPQLDRLRDRFGIELLGDIALDSDRLDVPNLFKGRAEGETVQQMDDDPIGDRLGAGRQ